MSASLALLFTGNATSGRALIAVALFALFMFLLLELRERSSMRFNKKEVVEIQEIFMERDKGKYAERIDAYEFRDMRLNRLNRKEKLRHLIGSTKSGSVAVWYGFWIIALIVALFSYAAVEKSSSVGLKHETPKILSQSDLPVR
jgi:hypothetical protein